MSSDPKTQKIANAESIVVRGARVHNLKNIDFEVPHNSLTVVTGVSGSGKSSLAFDTIYAEGQRRYVESLSAYARQFLERIEKPDADSIDGIAPAVAIRQKNTTRNPRSTVATATEIYDYLRLLFARVGRTYCASCGREVKRDTVDEVADAILALEPETRLQVLFPLQRPAPEADEAVPAKSVRSVKKKKAAATEQLSDALKTRLFDLRKAGFNRLYQAGQVFEFSTPESLLDLNFDQPVFVLVDRLSVSAESRSRVVDAIETAYREAGEVIFEIPQNAELSAGAKAPATLRFSQRFECKYCNIRYEEPEPRLFSFNNPYGACPKCQGFGNTIDFDLDLVIPDKSKTLAEGAIEPWTKPKYRPLFTDLKRYAKQAGVPLDIAWDDLQEEHRNLVLNGEGKFLGVRGFFNYLERKKYKLHVRVFLSRYRGYSQCSACNGSRLRLEARQVKIDGRNLCEICALTVEGALRFFSELTLTPEQAEIADKLLQEIRERLRFLNDVGLEYLTLDRLSSTLSGGEAQRIQLATSLGSRLVGTLYVLDEPSIGLHARDTHRLIRILHDLRNLGNTILVVEHDPDIMRAADRILDLGPGAGENGGKLVAAGTYDELLRDPASLTGRYLSHDLRIQAPAVRRKPGTQQITIRGVRANNLRNVDVSIPLGMIVAITGVSGSGKSTLLHHVLYRALAQAKHQSNNGASGPAASWESLTGDQFIDEIVLVDQSPIGRTPRSNPVTYIKAFDAIRELFASQPESKKRGLGPGHFSFNVPGGRCETCQGDGTVTVEMQFLADVELVCEECKGTRYKPQVLEVRYRGKNIHEVLNLTVKEALRFFAEAPKVTEKLRPLEEVGLGYLRLGQSATTLSGGEAQRMKLAAHLQPASRELSRSNRSNGQARPQRRLLYIFDEPTTGLHFDDVSKLLAAFRRLIEAGGSIVVIEHNLEVIKTADWVIDLGPEGGSRGGRIVGAGPPEVIAKIPGSHTGEYLARLLPAAAALLPVALLWITVFCSAVCGLAHCQNSNPPATASTESSQSTDQTQSQPQGSSSSRTVHHRTGTYSSETIRHTRVVDEGSTPPELARAEDLIQKRDYAGAAPLLQKVVAADPTNYVAWFDLGFAENGLGRIDDSISAYRKSVAAKPDIFESNLNLGLQLAKTNQPDAEQFMRAATHLKPANQTGDGLERAWLSLAQVLEASKPEESLIAYRQAATLQPKDAEPHVAAGLLLEKQQKYSDAVEEYKQALALDPNSDALTGLANVYLRGRQFPEAEQYLRQLVAAHPEDAGAHIELGRVLVAQGKNDAAIPELQAGVKLAPEDASAQLDLAELYTTLGKNDQADAAYRALIAHDPKDAELHRKLGQTLLREKKSPEAQQEFLAAIKLKPDLGEAYGDLAFAASENKEYPLALKALDARSKFLPESPPTYFLRASAFDHLKDYKQAAVNFHLFLNTANGKYPDQEWQAKHRLIAIEPKK